MANRYVYSLGSFRRALGGVLHQICSLAGIFHSYEPCIESLGPNTQCYFNTHTAATFRSVSGLHRRVGDDGCNSK